MTDFIAPDKAVSLLAVGTAVRCLADNCPAEWREDWRDWNGYVAGVHYEPRVGLNYSVCDQFPPHTNSDMTDGFRENQLEALTHQATEPTEDAPVAWRWCYEGDGRKRHWLHRGRPIEAFDATPGYCARIVEPLYTRSAALASNNAGVIGECPFDAAIDAVMAAEGALARAAGQFPDKGECAIRAVVDVERSNLKQSRQHLLAARAAK